jgi:hypothetical protein
LPGPQVLATRVDGELLVIDQDEGPPLHLSAIGDEYKDRDRAIALVEAMAGRVQTLAR